MKNKLIQIWATKAIKYGLKQLRNYMSTEDFLLTVDEVLDRIEDHFAQGSFADVIAEDITNEIREYFKIEDNDNIGV